MGGNEIEPNVWVLTIVFVSHVSLSRLVERHVGEHAQDEGGEGQMEFT